MTRYYWMLTYSGRKVRLDEPTPDMIDMDDIAHHLALINRFAGATREPYSVAEHSLHVCDYLIEMYPGDRQLALYGLLHDAHEAYLGELISPAKWQMRAEAGVDAYEMLARRLDRVIFQAAGLPPVMSPRIALAVADADAVMLATEARDLMSPHPDDWGLKAAPLKERIRDPLPGRMAGRLWARRYEGLTA